MSFLPFAFQEDDKNQELLSEKLSRLNRKQLHDPVLALGRDNMYKEELWEDHFDEWESGKDSSFDHVVKSNAGQLCAVAAMRTIGMAHAQHEKYLKACKTLEKTGRNFLKVQEALNLVLKFLLKLCSKYLSSFEMQRADFVLFSTLSYNWNDAISVAAVCFPF